MATKLLMKPVTPVLAFPGSTFPTAYPVGSQKKKPHFGGMFKINGKDVYITKVIYNNPATVVFWSDGKKTTCKCQQGDTYNKEIGLMLCVLKRLASSEQVAKLFNDWVTEDNVIDLKKVRENQKVKVELKV